MPSDDSVEQQLEHGYGDVDGVSDSPAGAFRRESFSQQRAEQSLPAFARTRGVRTFANGVAFEVFAEVFRGTGREVVFRDEGLEENPREVSKLTFADKIRRDFRERAFS